MPSIGGHLQGQLRHDHAKPPLLRITRLRVQPAVGAARHYRSVTITGEQSHRDSRQRLALVEIDEVDNERVGQASAGQRYVEFAWFAAAPVDQGLIAGRSYPAARSRFMAWFHPLSTRFSLT